MAHRLAQCTEIGARYLRDRPGLAETRREARLLMMHVLHLAEHRFFADPDRVLTLQQFRRFASLIRRRYAGEPFAYLIGHREFFSVNFTVNPSVLIPRPETEELIELVLKELEIDTQTTSSSKEPADGLRILDIGTGSGNIAAILARTLSEAMVTAVDLSVDALETARLNLLELGLDRRVRLLHSDLLDALNSDDRFDLIVSNPPYVLAGEFEELQSDVKDFEPRSALVVDRPEHFFTRFFEQAKLHLRTGGRLYLESGPSLLSMQKQLAESVGFTDVRIVKDLSGHDRFLVTRSES